MIIANPLGELFVKVGADTKGLKTGLQGAEKQVGGFANSIKKHHKAIGIAMAAAGAAIIAMGVKSVMTYAKMGDEVQKMALRTGFSTEALSELRHAAELSGASLEGIEKASRTLSGAITDASFGLETYVRAFDQIGLSYKDLKDKSPEKQFLMVMEALAGVEDATLRAAIAADIMGRSGTAMLPMLADGADGLAKMRQEAHTLGIVFDQEAANKAAEFNDALTRLKGAFNGVQKTIASIFVPALTALLDKIKDVVAGMSEWAKQHETLTKVMVFLTTAMGGLLLTLAPLIILLDSLIDIWIAIRAVMMTKILPAIGKVVAALWAKVAALYAAMVAMGPAGWAMAAASMVLIAAGLAFATLKAADAIRGFTSVTKDYIPTANNATTVTREWEDSLISLEKITSRMAQVENALTQATGEQSRSERELVNVRLSLLAQGGNLVELDLIRAKAQLGVTEAVEEYVDILLLKEDRNKEEERFLKSYLASLKKIKKAEDAHQKELKETNRLLEEQANAYKTAIDKVKDAIEALQYERSAAGALRISIGDIIKAMHLMGLTNEEVAETLVNLGDEQDNVLKVLDAFGIKAEDVAKILDIETESVDSLKDAYDDLSKSIEKIPIPQLPAHPAYGAGKIEPGMSAYQIGYAKGLPAEELEYLQHGGIVTKPTLAVLGERGKEAVIPLDRGGLGMNLTINFTEPVFMEREESISKLADKIYGKIKQEQRFSFGRAYGG